MFECEVFNLRDEHQHDEAKLHEMVAADILALKYSITDQNIERVHAIGYSEEDCHVSIGINHDAKKGVTELSEMHIYFIISGLRHLRRMYQCLHSSTNQTHSSHPQYLPKIKYIKLLHDALDEIYQHKKMYPSHYAWIGWFP